MLRRALNNSLDWNSRNRWIYDKREEALSSAVQSAFSFVHIFQLAHLEDEILWPLVNKMCGSYIWVLVGLSFQLASLWGLK